jgi:hypothetical protein
MTIPAGSVLDPYDDDFASLRTFFKDRRPPDFIKTASVMDARQHAALPDHAFAVILVDDKNQLRKYACTDKAHTAVNVLYFLEHQGELPPTARVKTAENLVRACRRFELRPPVQLVKVSALRKRLIKTDGAEIVNVPSSPPEERSKASSFMESPYVRMDEVDYAFAKHAAEESMCALPDGRLPLYSFTQVKQAAEYFDQTAKSMHPRVRHQLCCKLVKRADEICIPVSDVVRKYGSLEYAPDGEFEATVSTRRQLWKQADNQDGPCLLELLLEKRASVEPEVFAETLAKIDASTGIDRYWDNGLCDPWLTTFGFQKKAANWSWENNGVKINERQLKKLASNQQLVAEKFGEAMAEGLAENPTVVFDSLPVDTKSLIASMAQHS